MMHFSMYKIHSLSLKMLNYLDAELPTTTRVWPKEPSNRVRLLVPLIQHHLLSLALAPQSNGAATSKRVFYGVAPWRCNSLPTEAHQAISLHIFWQVVDIKLVRLLVSVMFLLDCILIMVFVGVGQFTL